MSFNDTDKWASMIINEIVGKSNASEKISTCTSTDNKVAIHMNKRSEISENAKGLNLHGSANYKNYHPCQASCSYEEILKEYGLKSDGNNAISDMFDKADSSPISRVSQDESIHRNAENMTSDYDLMSDAEIIQEHISEMVDGSTQKTANKKIEICDFFPTEFITQNAKVEMMLIDLDEAFNKNARIDSPKVDDNASEILTENIKASSKNMFEDSHGKSDIFDSLSFRESHNEHQEKTNECSMTADDKFSRNTSEKLCVGNDDVILSRSLIETNSSLDALQDKNEFKTGKISCSSVDLKPKSRSSEKYLKKIDEKIESVGFPHLQKGNSRNANKNIKRSNSLVDLYHHWFRENYIKEELEYRWGSEDRFLGNENSEIIRPKIDPAHRLKSISSGENLNEKINNVLNEEEGWKKWKPKHKKILDENFVNKEKSVNDTCPRIISYSLNEISAETKRQQVDNINEENAKEIKRGLDPIGVHQLNKCNKNIAAKNNLNKSIFTVKRFIGEQKDDGFAKEVQGLDDEELEIKNEKINFVVFIYREICSACETVFIQPFASVFFNFYEFFTFIFFLIICLLYMFYEKVQFLILNYRLLAEEKPSTKKKRNAISVPEKKMSPVTGLDATLIKENTLLRREKIANLPFKKKKIISFKHSFVEIEPEEVVAISLNYELVTKSIRHFYDKGENYLSFICNKEQHTATVKENTDCEIDFEVINNIERDENKYLQHENDFDMEVLASSEKLCLNNETDAQKEHNLYYLQGVLDQYASDCDLEPIIGTNFSRPFVQTTSEHSCRDDKPLLNSTEVNGLETSSKSCEVLSTSNIIYFEDYSNWWNSPQTKRKDLNSSLNVNLPSFSLRADSLADSIPLMNKPGSFKFNESPTSADDIKISNRIKIETHSVSLPASDFLTTEVSQNVPTIEEKIKKGNSGNFLERRIDEKVKNSSAISHIEAQNSEGFEISNIAEVHFDKNDVCKSSFDDANFISGSCNPANNSDLPKESDTSDEDKNNIKRKNTLRRRISFIFNNWKNLQMVSCMVKNPKKKKKYKKNR